jgi:hypothetical protein
MSGSEPNPDILPQRLCSEVQLFDLCDLDSCGRKNGRFCADPFLLDRFEKIAEEELRAPDRSVSEEIDDSDVDDSDGDGYDDEAEMGNYEGVEDDGWEDEE